MARLAVKERKVLAQENGKGFVLYHADCVEALAALPDNSVHYTIFSPPFVSLYTFSDDARDLSNCKETGTFFSHYRFVAEQLVRVTKPGRLVTIHCMDTPTQKVRDGCIGLNDFPGDLIRAHQMVGMIYHSRVCIWKNPVTAMQRTKAIGLLHRQLVKDSTMSRMGIADYMITMRKPGENEEPVAGRLTRYFGDDERIPKEDTGRKHSHEADSYSVKVWQRYASPVWMDIDQGDVLPYRDGRAEQDERHISPLQLTPIRRCLELWSLPEETVLSPFAGIGSEGVCALEMGRRFVGMELKASYYRQAFANLKNASRKRIF